MSALSLTTANLLGFPLGCRVRCLATGRRGLVTGLIEPGTGSRRYIPITVEGSTRRELWAAHATEPLERAQQVIALGGCFKPPAGYPLIPPKD